MCWSIRRRATCLQTATRSLPRCARAAATSPWIRLLPPAGSASRKWGSGSRRRSGSSPTFLDPQPCASLALAADCSSGTAFRLTTSPRTRAPIAWRRTCPLTAGDERGSSRTPCMSRDVREHRGRLAQVRLGEAQERVAPLARLPFPQPILLPAVAGVVEGVAVELDREPVLGPAAVDALGAGGAVGGGGGQPSFCEPLEESLLEAAEGDGSVAVEDASEPRRARRLDTHHCLDLRRRRPVANPGLVAGPGEVIKGERGGEVDEGLGDGGDRDASPECCSAFAAVH